MSSKLIVDTIEDSTGTYSLALGSGNSTFPGGIHIGGTGSANLLDDYEEGEHTATITTGSGSVTLTSGGNTLYYTKVGRLVTIIGTLRVSSVSSPSGTCAISLPFTSYSPTTGEGQIGGFVTPNLVNSGNNNEVAIELGENASSLNLYKSGTSSLADAGNIFQYNTTLRINFSYFTA